MPGPPFLAPADYSKAEIIAVQALATGTANEGQQKLALDWIVTKVCKTYDLSFHPDSEHGTSFAEGKRHAGLQIVKLLGLKPGQFKE